MQTPPFHKPVNRHIDMIFLNPPVEVKVSEERTSHIIQFTPKYDGYLVINQCGVVIGRGNVQMWSLGV